MSVGTLYTYPGNPRAFKAQIVAELNGLELNVPEFIFGVTNRTEDFMSKFPFGKVPAFESVDGTCIYESNAISYYVASLGQKVNLLGDSLNEQATVMQYLNVIDNELVNHVSTWLYPILGYAKYDAEKTQYAQRCIEKTMTVFDKLLSDRCYLLGNDLVLADVHLVCALYMPYKMLFDETYRERFPNVTNYFTRVTNVPEFSKVMGPITYAQVMAKYREKSEESYA
ncbi:MAG: putative elongation factor 1-gamma-A-like [Terrestrivirus sp.]|uniref:Putative elongation factor 1-gamma-A-like n=1 Tax=Terrestrivirus sp. TaxID=2487775 RepID=A0A3G4ZKB2_9VIRU|nr:MAG: putative elongation factor 1-gamma-A-like [Terrestrivirus sp.]